MSLVPTQAAQRPAIALLLAGWLAVPHTAGAQSLGLDAGHGDHVDVLAIELASRPLREWAVHSRWRLDVRVAGRVAYWHGQPRLDDVDELWDASVTPIFHLEPAASWRHATPYLELGVGVHLLSNTSLSGREFGTAFQFGQVAGLGLRFGTRQQYDIGFRVHHVSNGSIDDHNDGLTFASVGLAYHFAP